MGHKQVVSESGWVFRGVIAKEHNDLFQNTINSAEMSYRRINEREALKRQHVGSPEAKVGRSWRRRIDKDGHGYYKTHLLP